MTWEADGVLSLTLADPAGGPLPSWTPGAHVDLDLAPGLRRSYSLCGDPADERRWQVAVLREPSSRGGSEYVHARMRPGDLLPVADLRNNFELKPAAEYLFIAGGIGITPLLPMIAAAQAARVTWRLLYGGRRRSSMAFLDALAAYGPAGAGPQALVRVLPEDESGLLPVAEAVAAAGRDAVVYCCGPEPLLAAVEKCCADAGRGLRVERFAARPAAGPAGPDSPFDVVCQRAGVTVTVAAGQTMLDALEQAGLPVVSSCQEGVCGTCETAVLDGDIDHRDSLLSDAERAAGDTMLICVSRSRSARLVLDL
jgi:ferredoxin-NADP reductase